MIWRGLPNVVETGNHSTTLETLLQSAQVYLQLKLGEALQWTWHVYSPCMLCFQVGLQVLDKDKTITKDE